MTGKKFKGAPFLTQKERFDLVGIHPNRKPPGSSCYVTDCRTLPQKKRTVRFKMSSRDRNPLRNKIEEKIAITEPWKRALHDKVLAKFPTLLFRGQHRARAILASKGGPGSYEYKDFIQDANSKPGSNRGICATLSQRFAIDTRLTVPGPGTYGIKGIPAAEVEEKNRRSKGNITIMQGASGDRSLPATGCHIGPGTYNPKFTKEDNKMIAWRNPHDLYSPSYEDTEKSSDGKGPKTWPGKYDIRSFTDDLVDKHGVQKGRFSKNAEQHPKKGVRIYCNTLAQCPKDLAFPGPGAYEPQITFSKPASVKPPPFLLETRRDDKCSHAFFVGRMITPLGPGRYDKDRWQKQQHKNGHCSIFKSTTARDMKAWEKALFETRFQGNAHRFENHKHNVPVRFSLSKCNSVRIQ